MVNQLERRHGVINLSFETVDIGEMHPQMDMGLHGHRFGELVLIQSGRAIHFTEHQEYEISGHDIFFIKKGTLHGYRECENLHLINIFFHHDMIAGELNELKSQSGYRTLFEWESQTKMKARRQKHFNVGENEWAELMVCYASLKNETYLQKDHHLLMRKWLLMRIILLCSRFFNEQLESSAEIPMSHTLTSVAHVMAYIEKHYEKKIYTDDLATISKTSLSTLQRNFKNVHGTSLSEHLNRVRIRHACSALRSSDLSIDDIAFSVGFENSNYFTKVFRKYMGNTPRVYRDMRVAPYDTR